MNRKTLTALVAFAALAVIALFALRQPEKGERSSERPRPMAKINAGDVDTLEVTRGGATTVIKKDGAKYKVTSPVAYAADETTAKAAFDAMDKLDFSNLVTEQKGKEAEFDVDDAKAVHVVGKSEKQGNKVIIDLFLGKPVAGGTMARPAGKDEIWAVNGIFKYSFDKPPADWRDKSVTTFTAADAEKIDVKAKDGTKLTAKKLPAKEGGAGGGDHWEVVDSSVKIDKLDESVPSSIVSALATFKANDFADAAKPAETGLDTPALTVTVGLKGGKNVTLLVGNKKGDDDYYVKTPEGAQIYVAKKYSLDRANKRPLEFRDKTLCDIAEPDLADVAVTNGDKSYALSKAGSDWKATKPAKLEIDTAKITPIASAFKDWKASGFAEDPSPKAAGLDKPTAVIVAKSKKGAAASCTLKVGGESKDKQSYFVQTGKSPDVYVVAKWAADRVLVKPDDLKKPGSTSVAKK
jgi:Domain of unknown function (DUF4340)